MILVNHREGPSRLCIPPSGTTLFPTYAGADHAHLVHPFCETGAPVTVWVSSRPRLRPSPTGEVEAAAALRR